MALTPLHLLRLVVGCVEGRRPSLVQRHLGADPSGPETGWTSLPCGEAPTCNARSGLV